MVSRRVPSLIKSITLVVLLLTLGATVGVPANSLRADKCLAAPDSPSPQGTHWYYQLDWATQRKCWHLRAPDRPLRRGAATAAAPLHATPVQFGRRHSADGPPISVDPADTASPSSRVDMLSVRPPTSEAITATASKLVQQSVQQDASAPPLVETPAQQESTCRRLATRRQDGLSLPLRRPIPYPPVQRLRHNMPLRSQPIRLRIRPSMLQRELPAAASRPTTPGSLW